jgi:hypothetical protein
MPHNRHTFSDRQLWQLSGLTAGRIKDKNVYIVACHFDSFQQKLRQIKRKKSPSTSAESKRLPIVVPRHGVI